MKILLGIVFVTLQSLLVSQLHGEDLAIEALRGQTETYLAEVKEANVRLLEEFDNAERNAKDRTTLALVNVDRSVFLETKQLPAWLDSGVQSRYLRSIELASRSLINDWEKEINDYRRKRNMIQAERAENHLGEILRTTRGYGLAMPSLRVLEKQTFMIQNRANGLVMDLDGHGNVILSRPAKTRQQQRWQLIVFQDSVAIQNVKRKKVLNIPRNENAPEIQIILYSKTGDEKNEKWSLLERGRSLIIKSKYNGLVLGFGSNNTRTSSFVVQRSDETTPEMNRWLLVF